VNQWLQGFAYRIDVSVTPFIVGGVCMVTLTVVTMAYQVLKAARMNPVVTLRQG